MPAALPTEIEKQAKAIQAAIDEILDFTGHPEFLLSADMFSEAVQAQLAIMALSGKAFIEAVNTTCHQLDPGGLERFAARFREHFGKDARIE